MTEELKAKIYPTYNLKLVNLLKAFKKHNSILKITSRAGKNPDELDCRGIVEISIPSKNIQIADRLTNYLSAFEYNFRFIYQYEDSVVFGFELPDIGSFQYHNIYENKVFEIIPSI